MPDNFFAILEDGDFRLISALPPVEAFVRGVFVNIGDAMIQGKEEVLFNGNYHIEADQILYVEMDISESFDDVINNPAGIPVLNEVAAFVPIFGIPAVAAWYLAYKYAPGG